MRELVLVLGALTRLLGSSDDDWIERPMLPFCRKGHVAVRGHYDDEHFIIVFGGEGLNYKESSSYFLDDIWVLSLNLDDMRSSQFEWKLQASPPSSSQFKRWGFGAAANGRGGMVVLGGMDSSRQYMTDLWDWQPWSGKRSDAASEGTWIDLSSLPPVLSELGVISTATTPCARIGMQTGLLRSGLIIGIGGAAKSSVRRKEELLCLSDAYVLNLNQLLSSLNVNGLSLDVSDDHSGLESAWSRLPDMPGPCLTGVAIEVVNIGAKEYVFVFGGSHNSVKGETFSSNLWLYDVLLSQWSLVGPSYGTAIWPEGRDRHAITYVKKLNAVFVFGGRGQSSCSSSTYEIMSDLWMFDLIARSWKRLFGSAFGSLRQYQIPDARSLHSLTAWCGVKDDKPVALVLFGGQLTSKINIPVPTTLDPSIFPSESPSEYLSSTVRDTTGGTGGTGGTRRQGGDYHMMDDDSAWAWNDNTVHAQTNDIWVYYPTRDVWQIVSSGGCHKGDTGQPNAPDVDLTALFVVATLVSAGIVGILGYSYMQKFRTDYSAIPDEERRF